MCNMNFKLDDIESYFGHFTGCFVASLLAMTTAHFYRNGDGLKPIAPFKTLVLVIASEAKQPTFSLCTFSLVIASEAKQYPLIKSTK